MVVRPVLIRAIPSLFVPRLHQSSCIQVRKLHSGVNKPTTVPPPTPFVPDVQAFLSVIGRNLSQHAPKISSWSALFSLRGPQLKELGIEPPRSRRYLLRWLHKFRTGEYGIGGDASTVIDGAIPLRVIEVPIEGSRSRGTSTAGLKAGMERVVVNLPYDAPATDVNLDEIRIRGVKIGGLHTITGPHVQHVKGGESGKWAVIKFKEGLWEDVRGRKIDGGERRQADVRAKRRAEERKSTRA